MAIIVFLTAISIQIFKLSFFYVVLYDSIYSNFIKFPTKSTINRTINRYIQLGGTSNSVIYPLLYSITPYIILNNNRCVQKHIAEEWQVTSTNAIGLSLVPCQGKRLSHIQ